MDVVYLVSSFMFIVIFITELDLTTQNSIATLYTFLFFTRPYDLINGFARPQIASPNDLKIYLRDGLLPELFQKREDKYQGLENFESHQKE